MFVQVACDPTTTSQAGDGGPDDAATDAPVDPYDDGGPADAAQDVVDDSPDDAPDDAPDDSPVDAPADSPAGVGAFAGASGSYVVTGSPLCYMTNFTLTVQGTIVANPFAMSGAVTFTLKAGTTDQATAANVSVAGLGASTCTLTINGTALSATCLSQQMTSCTQTFQKN